MQFIEPKEPNFLTLSDTHGPVEDTIRGRHSCRSYLPKPISQDIIKRVLETASHAPSGSNFQPWRVYVLSGTTLEKVGNAVRSAFLADEQGHKRDYTYYPAK